MKSELIPVIHMINQNQVLTNVKTCIESGIEKVFIINHVVSIEDLIQCANRVKLLYPNLWVGINMLGQSTELSLLLETGLDGLMLKLSQRSFKEILKVCFSVELHSNINQSQKI